ncbi:helix-turn-helix domain-containing protein [Marinoscillum furvescens]|uniref:AraC family transcriptional regulator n=1 Tax=Marinoscillum furvescens DSM 4134 TaxID=1122208 RepID=A0A3D9KZ53_MARFU|nr:helix-turn-helix domain-containing protein [Marinoscillum furvescens]RED95569.1 AraC family transcriptional regulator [Marinoscillum furvescens DSM 4134]
MIRKLFIGIGLSLLVAVLAHAQYAYTTTFVIEELPASTPHDAALFMATDMDGWYPDLGHRKFTKRSDGQLVLTIRHNEPTFQYKITRGNWKSVEARENGRARPNRTHIATLPSERVGISILSWEDTAYPSYTLYMYFLIISAIQGVLLIIAINTIRNKNKVANTFLTALLTLITISLLGRASTFDPEVFNWQPKLLFVPELILFTYGPLFYLYIHKLLVIHYPTRKAWLHFVPAAIQLSMYLPYLPMERQAFIYRVIDKELFPYFAITGIIALFFNAGYWVLSHRLITRYQQEPLSDKQKKYTWFLSGVLKIKAVYLALWLAVVLIFLGGKLMEKDWLYLSENLIDVLWLLFSLIIFALAYFAIKHPELLRQKQKYKDGAIKQDEISIVMSGLYKQLEQEKVYLQPDLTLEKLAHLIPTAPHTLSRVINEQYQQSFSELINSYRVEEFIRRVNAQDNPSYLEVAYSVGFNSKPTFNRAFKKLKNCTPRVYFKSQTDSPVA